MANGAWTLGDATADFSQTLDKETTGNEGNGDEITSAEGTFHDAAADTACRCDDKVVFTNASGVDRTLTASIGDTQWTMGTTVTYKLSITPEYELNLFPNLKCRMRTM